MWQVYMKMEMEADSWSIEEMRECKGKTLLELEETHSGNGKGLRHSQVVLEARDFL
jgi:hypothetical protein